MLTRRPAGEGRSGEAGFSLIETLVAMVAGVIVIGALFAILEVGLHQSARLNDVNVATKTGRATMTRMVDELHSACVSAKYAPVKEGSSETKLIFVNGYGKSSTLPIPSAVGATKGFEGIHRDTLEWEEKPAANSNKEGILRDKTVTATGESAGSYTYGEESIKGGSIIGERISPSETKVENAKGEKVFPPIFSYYAYASSASTGTGAASSTLTPIELKGGTLSEPQAKTVAAVGIAFHALPTDKLSTINRSIKETGVDVNSLVTLAFSAPTSEATIKGGPCE